MSGNANSGKGARTARNVPVLLECGYALMFASTHLPEKTEELWCPRHREVTRQIVEYRVKCDTCRYGRGYGNAPITAQTKATAHAMKRPGHSVEVTFNGQHVSRHGTPINTVRGGGQLTISAAEPPPF